MMMAGLDGIQNKIHPGDPADKDLYDLEPEEAKHIPQVCHSLDMALECLDKDREFLKRGGVFTDDVIDAYMGLKIPGNHALPHVDASVRARYVLQRLSGLIADISGRKMNTGDDHSQDRHPLLCAAAQGDYAVRRAILWLSWPVWRVLRRPPWPGRPIAGSMPTACITPISRIRVPRSSPSATRRPTAQHRPRPAPPRPAGKPKGSGKGEFRYASCAVVQPAEDQVLLNVEAGQRGSGAGAGEAQRRSAGAVLRWPADRGAEPRRSANSASRRSTGARTPSWPPCAMPPAGTLPVGAVTFHVRQPSASIRVRPH